MPLSEPDPVSLATVASASEGDSRRYRWYHKMSAVLLITFCMEIGFFLVIFPWTEFWEANYFSSLVPEWRHHWDNMYVRGGISGLGVINLWISFAEIFRLRRFARRRS